MADPGPEHGSDVDSNTWCIVLSNPKAKFLNNNKHPKTIDD